MPLTEHPFYGSWGYQTTGYFAPTSRYGTPQDFMYLIDYLHQHGIGVILDWVPSHFPSDEHGLGYFDGTHLYEHADPQQGFHPDWKSCIFNYGRHEVRSFLLSAAPCSGWTTITSTACASMRSPRCSTSIIRAKQGEWIPNEYGGNENLEAIDFLRRFNEEVYRNYPDVQTIAEESTAWPMVSRPTYLGGLGFGLKWDMGWMHDTLDYFSREPIHRQYHHNEAPLPHALRLHGEFRAAAVARRGGPRQGIAVVARCRATTGRSSPTCACCSATCSASRARSCCSWAASSARGREWNHDASLDWHQSDYPQHAGILRLVATSIASTATKSACTSTIATGRASTGWTATTPPQHSACAAQSDDDGERILVVCNFTPVPRDGYRVGVPYGGHWKELLNSDATAYGGGGTGNCGGMNAEPQPWHGQPHSLVLTLPPLGVVFLKGMP